MTAAQTPRYVREHAQPPRRGPSFLTVAEVAAMLRVSKMGVYRLANSGELPAVRVGRSIRIYESAVVDYLRGSLIADEVDE